MTSDTSPRPVTPLRARMIEDMTVRGFKEDETRYYSVAPSPRRSTSFSASRHCYPSDCELSCATTGAC